MNSEVSISEADELRSQLERQREELEGLKQKVKSLVIENEKLALSENPKEITVGGSTSSSTPHTQIEDRLMHALQVCNFVMTFHGYVMTFYSITSIPD